jgi:hypothetical protein
MVRTARSNEALGRVGARPGSPRNSRWANTGRHGERRRESFAGLHPFAGTVRSRNDFRTAAMPAGLTVIPT